LENYGAEQAVVGDGAPLSFSNLLKEIIVAAGEQDVSLLG
jgi:hypothetical protein